MAFNNGVFSRLYNWVQDKANSVKINATRMDAEMDGMATGLSTAMLKDGTQTLTANIPYAGFKNTGMGAGSSRTDSSRVAEIQDSTFTYGGTSTGTDTVAITTAPVITAYVVGQRFQFKAGGTNTGATTLNVDTVGAGAVQKLGAALVAADITAGDIVDVEVSATTPVFQMLSPARTPVLAAGAVTGSGKIVRDTSPTLVTPVLGVAAATSLTFGGSALSSYVGATNWTPTLVLGGGSVTYTTQFGRYVRIGDFAFCYGRIVVNVATTPSGQLSIGGLPFTIINQSGNEGGVGSIQPQGWAATLTTPLVARLVSNTTTVRLFKYSATTGAGSDTGADVASGCDLFFSFILPIA